MDDILHYIEERSGMQQALMRHLHSLITADPRVRGKLRYKIPFYDLNTWVCYLNPVAGNGVELVFLHGQVLSNEQGVLDDKGRKMVRGVTLRSLGDVPVEVLHELLQEAMLLDELLAEEKKAKARRR